ncbi:tetratricopeptide repeat protein [Streptomyces sp. NPDC056160]|uniref:tetratricopeptide repeat protein n=1 Tax=Streptomyces sp. NPDC056160 TaxID=3345731 RepID=UPI0035E1C38F
MKSGKLWMGLAAATAAGATGVTIWALQPDPAALPEAKVPSTSPRIQQANALLQGGLLQQKLQDSKGAATTYQRVLKLDPHNKFAWYNLGVIAQQDGKKTDARTNYDRALKIDPSFTPALLNEGILLSPDEPELAMKLLRHAVAVDSSLYSRVPERLRGSLPSPAPSSRAGRGAK